jgi:predicted transcriptional regulator
LREAILSFLKKNPKSKKTEIAQAVGFDPAKITPQLTKLKDEGLVKTEGSRRDMVYRVG